MNKCWKYLIEFFKVFFHGVFERTFNLFDVWVIIILVVMLNYTYKDWEFWVGIIVGTMLSVIGHNMFVKKLSDENSD